MKKSEKRQSLVSKLKTTAVGLGVLALANPQVQAFDFDYPLYERASKVELEEIVAKNDFPHEFDFCYEIPENKDHRGKRVDGSFRVTRTNGNTQLTVDIIHSNENKVIELSEKIEGDSIYYTEMSDNFVKEEREYDTTVSRIWYSQTKTPITLINRIFSGELKDCEFVFRGNEDKWKKYGLDLKSQEQQNGNRVIEIEVKKNGPKLKKIKVFYEDVMAPDSSFVSIPVEIHAEYKIKIPGVPAIFGLNYDAHTIKAVLKDSAGE